MNRQMGQELLHLPRPKVARVPLAKMPDKSFNPIDVCILGSNAVMFQANFAPHLIEQTGR